MEDIATRDTHSDEEFSMKIGDREFSGKDARTNAGNALNTVALSWANDKTLQVRSQYKGFDILTRGSATRDGMPELFVAGKEMYKAHLNFDNPLGTISSIEHQLRGLDRRAEDERLDIERQEKTLADYRTQLDRKFDHEARLKELVLKQAELNALLDLDKHEAQIVSETAEQLPHPIPSKVAIDSTVVPDHLVESRGDMPRPQSWVQQFANN